MTQTRNWWNIDDFSFPMPLWDVSCWVGGDPLHRVQFKRFDLHRSDDRTVPCRVDVRFRCTDCSLVLPPFGVAVSEEMHRDLKENHIGLRWVGALSLMVRRGEIKRTNLRENMDERVQQYLEGTNDE